MLSFQDDLRGAKSPVYAAGGVAITALIIAGVVVFVALWRRRSSDRERRGLLHEESWQGFSYTHPPPVPTRGHPEPPPDKGNWDPYRGSGEQDPRLIQGQYMEMEPKAGGKMVNTGYVTGVQAIPVQPKGGEQRQQSLLRFNPDNI